MRVLFLSPRQSSTKCLRLTSSVPFLLSAVFGAVTREERDNYITAQAAKREAAHDPLSAKEKDFEAEFEHNEHVKA